MKIDRKNPRHWWLLLKQCVYTLLGLALRPLRGEAKPSVILYGHQLSGNLKALYAFWQDQRAEVFLSARPVEPAGDTTAAWQRAFTTTMQANADALAALVRARDPEPFETVIGGDAPRINPVYDLWLRATGRAGEIPGRRTPRSNAEAGADR